MPPLGFTVEGHFGAPLEVTVWPSVAPDGERDIRRGHIGGRLVAQWGTPRQELLGGLLGAFSLVLFIRPPSLEGERVGKRER